MLEQLHEIDRVFVEVCKSGTQMIVYLRERYQEALNAYAAKCSECDQLESKNASLLSHVEFLKELIDEEEAKPGSLRRYKEMEKRD